MEETEIELTEEELGNINEFEEEESGTIIKSRTGRINENSCYGK
jgi:hypothetical protein